MQAKWVAGCPRDRESDVSRVAGIQGGFRTKMGYEELFSNLRLPQSGKPPARRKIAFRFVMAVAIGLSLCSAPCAQSWNVVPNGVDRSKRKSRSTQDARSAFASVLNRVDRQKSKRKESLSPLKRIAAQPPMLGFERSIKAGSRVPQQDRSIRPHFPAERTIYGRQPIQRVQHASDELPVPSRHSIAVGGIPEVRLQHDGELISLVARDASLKEILANIAKTQNLNIVFSSTVDSQLNISLDRVPWQTALETILSIAGFTSINNNGIIVVTDTNNGNRLAPSVQGRIMRVFELDYASAEDCDVAVKGLLSSIGQSIPTTSNPINNLKTKEILVVEDLPEFVERVATYIAQVDQPPRQVLIEAHILEIELRDDLRHGVNFEELAHLVDPSLTIRTQGFANSAAPQAFIMELDGARLDGLLEALKTTTDAKTLASPRILALNGQESKLQIGEQLGFRIVTVTETSSLESVDFIDVGVVLRVLPRISRDGRILMNVKPEVSSGQVNPETGLPEEATTELQTDVLLSDGQGIVLGGLIKEEITNLQSKVPLVGNIPWVGSAFQRRQLIKSRSEVVIALIPRIAPYEPLTADRNDHHFNRASSPLLEGSLNIVPRPYESNLPDPLEKTEAIRRNFTPRSLGNLFQGAR